LELEADVVATYLHRKAPVIERVIQVYSATEAGRYVADALRRALSIRGIEVEDDILGSDSDLGSDSLSWV
jgi:ABC-type branched-subunit amino acid transport system substrate-binding protein